MAESKKREHRLAQNKELNPSLWVRNVIVSDFSTGGPGP